MLKRFLGTALLGLFVLAAAPMVMAEDVTLEGKFVWAREDGDQDGPLKAVFTPTGEGAWDVSFHFDWEGEPHVYTGNCKGSMSGKLDGEVKSDGDREMWFKFNGAFEDGTFSGTHGFFQKADGEVKPGGTLTLAHAKKG